MSTQAPLIVHAGNVAIADSLQKRLLAFGDTVPSDGATGYKTGCIFLQTDGGIGTSFYVNEGSVTNADFNALTGTAAAVVDDSLFTLGTDADQALVSRSTTLNAATTLTGVVVGTPVTAAIPADSLIVSNVTADGDQVFMGQTGGNSQEWLRYDASAKLVVFNEASGDVDFRVETDGNANALVIDGGLNTVGICGAAVASQQLTVHGVLALGAAGTTLGQLLFNGNTSGTITIKSLAAAGTYTLTLPPDDGDAGEQLQTDGSGVMTWEAAGSLRAVKEVVSDLSAQAADALARLASTTVYAFRYRERARPTTGDYDTVYRGVMADELPEVMHHGGRIFSPVSAFGMATLAIQALLARIEALEAKLAGA